MPADQNLFDQDLFDESGNPLYPDRIYLPSIAEPCTKYVRLPSIPGESPEFGAFELQRAIYLSSIAGAERFGLMTLIVSMILPSIADDSAVGSITLTPGPVTIRLPSIQEPECS